jgi:hypothetical protein
MTDTPEFNSAHADTGPLATLPAEPTPNVWQTAGPPATVPGPRGRLRTRVVAVAAAAALLGGGAAYATSHHSSASGSTPSVSNQAPTGGQFTDPFGGQANDPNGGQANDPSGGQFTDPSGGQFDPGGTTTTN